MPANIGNLAEMGRRFRARKSGQGNKRINTRVLDVHNLTHNAIKKGIQFQKLFWTETLNDCVIKKEVVPESLKHLYKPHQLATKVFFPYSDTPESEGFGIGGKVVYINELNFEKKMQDNFIGSQPEEAQSHDLQVLDIFDTLPSLDPFLLRDKFQIEEIDVSEVYFEIPADEWSFIKSKVIDKFRPLAQIAFAGEGKDLERSTVRLVDIMWDAKDIKTLDPLTRALQVKSDDAGALYYAWKGIVYYEIKIDQIRSELNELIKRLKEFEGDPGKSYYDGISKIDWKKPIHNLMILWSGTESIMKTYNTVYDDFFVKGENPVSFRKFFETAEDLFWYLGTAVSIIDSVIEQGHAFPARLETNREKLSEFYYDVMELTKMN